MFQEEHTVIFCFLLRPIRALCNFNTQAGRTRKSRICLARWLLTGVRAISQGIQLLSLIHIYIKCNIDLNRSVVSLSCWTSKNFSVLTRTLGIVLAVYLYSLYLSVRGKFQDNFWIHQPVFVKLGLCVYTSLIHTFIHTFIYILYRCV